MPRASKMSFKWSITKLDLHNGAFYVFSFVFLNIYFNDLIIMPAQPQHKLKHPLLHVKISLVQHYLLLGTAKTAIYTTC